MTNVWVLPELTPEQSVAEPVRSFPQHPFASPFPFMAIDSRVIEALVLLLMFEEKGLSGERRNMEINIIRCIPQLFS
jgi:hypothetical protein